MKSNITISKEILATIDFNNTIMGGSVEPAVKINEGKEAFEIFVKVPSLSPDSLKVDIVDNKLWLYNMQAVLSNNEMIGFMPKTISSMHLPENIDREHISAKYEFGGWKIVLPIDTETKGFNKHIDIEF
jgi:HSP20 family protein